MAWPNIQAWDEVALFLVITIGKPGAFTGTDSEVINIGDAILEETGDLILQEQGGEILQQV